MTGKVSSNISSNGHNLPELPIELLSIIISYLSRQDVRNLRLVNRHCEANVSTLYFREIVVPFRSQVLNSSAPEGSGAFNNMPANLLSPGQRIFDEFGHLIRRFALSMELDETELESPPLKPRQEVIRRPWGLYRWPYREYRRYQDFSTIESDADEFERMKAALRCLSNTTNLGLCSDAGLGILSGPDVKARDNAILHRVFLGRRFEQNNTRPTITPSRVYTVGEALRTAGRWSNEACRVPKNWKEAVLKAMLQNAGFTEGQMEEAKALLLECENKSSASELDFDDDNPTPDIRPGQIEGSTLDMLLLFHLYRDQVPRLGETPRMIWDYALVPVALTRAQKEMLLELEWAHRAMTLSYILAAIDCSTEGCFRHLTTFDIAKIPSSHLHILSRNDLWESFPALKNVSLGVVADWRRVYVPAPGLVEDVFVSPLDAVPLAHTLINNYIGVQEKIESFHFEWICGGELASGCHQRGRYILPAPFFSSPQAMARPDMVRVGTDDSMLQLPYVKNLSLKNCWVAPHVLLQSLRNYARNSLERIEFEGVSLSAMPLVRRDVPPIVLYNLNNGLRQPSLGHWETAQPSLEQPSWMSWAGLIEHFSPSVKVRDAIDRQSSPSKIVTNAAYRQRTLQELVRIIPDALDLPDDETSYKLESLRFKSCGYVSVGHPRFNIFQMVPAPAVSVLMGTPPTQSEFTPLMQRCMKPLMGQIMNFAVLNDRAPLRDVFNMKMGWTDVYDSKITAAAFTDGGPRVGVGRFSGVLARDVGDVGPGVDSARILTAT